MNLASASQPRKGAAHSPPPCTGLGAQCHRLRVTLRVGSLDEGSTSLDHEATWLIGHTEHVRFGELWHGEGDLYVEATLHVPCRYLRNGNGRARCQAYGFEGPARNGRRLAEQPRHLGGDQFRVVDDTRLADQRLVEPSRTLPVLAAPNPCAGASCRTADHRRGAACCRDLQIEIMCARANARLEALVRSRRSPYLCKVTRPGPFSIEAEVISACGYLESDGVNCALHGRRRADGRPAKPDLCSDWPPAGKGVHPGCVFGPKGNGRPSR